MKIALLSNIRWTIRIFYPFYYIASEMFFVDIIQWIISEFLFLLVNVICKLDKRIFII